MPGTLVAQDVFGALRPEQINAISDASEKVTCSAGDVVYEEGTSADYFFVVLEGEVTLRMPGRSGVSVVIDQIGKGQMFGSCVCFYRDTYALTAQCTSDAVLLKAKSPVLRDLMDEDLMMGYALQTRISEIYFTRYIETMKKLQAIVMNIPIETA